MAAPAVLQHAQILDGARLRAARTRAGLTLAAVGEHVGRDLSLVGKWERNRLDVPGRTLGQLAALYGCSVADFYRPGAA